MLEAFVVLVGQKHVATEVKEAGGLSPASVGHDWEDPGLSSANFQADQQLTALLRRLATCSVLEATSTSEPLLLKSQLSGLSQGSHGRL